LLAHGRWFSPASSTTKTGRHDIAEILPSGIKTPKIKIIYCVYICIAVGDHIIREAWNHSSCFNPPPHFYACSEPRPGFQCHVMVLLVYEERCGCLFLLILMALLTYTLFK
jgi:hypothetical protein